MHHLVNTIDTKLSISNILFGNSDNQFLMSRVFAHSLLLFDRIFVLTY